jgi:putative endonuclease
MPPEVRTPKKEWSIYVVEAENGNLYTGIAKDPELRFTEHLNSKKGARFFRRSPPKAIRFQVSGFTHSEALKIEYRLKQLPRLKKQEMIETGNRKKLRALLISKKEPRR